MICTNCGKECFDNESPEKVFKDLYNCICEDCSIDYVEIDGRVQKREESKE
jgi:hypothetical protein